MDIIKYLKKKEIEFIRLFYSFLGLFTSKYGFKHQEDLYYKTYEDTLIQNPLGSSLVVMFDGRQIHCGLTDRFKGICTAYEFSKEFNMPFYINYTSPFNLTDYLVPKDIDWQVDVNKVLYNKNTSVPVFLNDWQTDWRFHKLYLKKIIKNNPGKQIHLYINSPYHIDKYKENYNKLFEPSSKLKECIESIMQSLGRDYVAMSFRFLQLLGDFKEEHTKFETLNEEDQIKLMENCENKVLELKKEHSIEGKILFTGDSSKFLNYMSARHDFVYVVPGEIAHIDNNHENNDAIYMKTFLDMYMLSHSKTIFQLCTGGMYANSAFARQAAILGGVSYNKIVF